MCEASSQGHVARDHVGFFMRLRSCDDSSGCRLCCYFWSWFLYRCENIWLIPSKRVRFITHVKMSARNRSLPGYGSDHQGYWTRSMTGNPSDPYLRPAKDWHLNALRLLRQGILVTISAGSRPLALWHTGCRGEGRFSGCTHRGHIWSRVREVHGSPQCLEDYILSLKSEDLDIKHRDSQLQ